MTEDRSLNQSSVPMIGGRESSLAMAHEDGDEADASVPRSSISTNRYRDMADSSVPRSSMSPVHHRRLISPGHRGDIADKISTWGDCRLLFHLCIWTCS